ncbi:MAG: hypothetical protein IKZ60_04060 [Bacteroidales bacterium]|nr:hypothetical protein [Bacteroidales bacterium]
MNNKFNFKRFWKYLRYDLVSAVHDSGTLMVSLAAMPVWFFVIQQLLSFVFNGEFRTINTAALIIAYIVSLTVTVIFFPVQHYGKLTDKKAGADWILIPASRFEKFLSMLIICCVVAPIVWFAIIAASDGLLSLVFGTYDSFILPTILDAMQKGVAEVHAENVKLMMNGPWFIYLSWCQNILAFALGAIFFRKNKIVYTFLTLMAIGILCTIITAVVFGGEVHISPEDITDDKLMRMLNWGLCAMYVVIFAVLDLGLYFRINTIKQ